MQENLIFNRITLPLILIIIFALSACSQTTPSGPNAIGGSLEQTSYLLLDWPQGLRILIWDDVYEGQHHNHSESATNEPMFLQSGDARATDGRGYEYKLETHDGLTAGFFIDEIAYDLSLGTVFLICTTGAQTKVKQLHLDLSGLSPTNAGIEAFGEQTPEIAAFLTIQPPPVMRPSAQTVPQSIKGYELYNYFWEGEWYFALNPGLNRIKPCAESRPADADEAINYTVKGVIGLKESLDQLRTGEFVTWCHIDELDPDVIDDIKIYSEQLGIQLIYQQK